MYAGMVVAGRAGRGASTRLTHVPNPTREVTYPSACNRSRTLTTVPLDSSYWLAKSLDEGSLAPGASRPSRMAERSSPYSQLDRVWGRDRLLRVSSNELMAFGISNGPIRLAKNGSVQCTNGAIISALKSRSAWVVIELCLLAELFMEIRQMKVGVWFYGLGTALTGILDIAWGEFDASHQPIQALGNNIAGQHLLAYAVGVWLVAAGLAILWRRSERIAAAASGIAYLIF